MRTMKHQIAVAAILVIGLVGIAQAQYYDPIMAEMQRLQHNLDQQVLYHQQQLQAMQQANMERFAAYYRQQTGDHQTPAPQAAELGVQLYCQHNAAECQRAAEGWQAVARRGHELRMGDIASFGQTALDVGRTNSEILDMSNEGHRNRQLIRDQGQEDFVRGVVRQEWTYADPSTGAGYELPIQPDPQARYSTPDGYPLSFDFNTGSWYVGDGYGSWRPLQPRR